MTEPNPSAGEAVSRANRITLDPVAGVMQRRASAAENSELMLADEVRQLRLINADLQARLAEREAE